MIKCVELSCHLPVDDVFGVALPSKPNMTTQIPCGSSSHTQQQFAFDFWLCLKLQISHGQKICL